MKKIMLWVMVAVCVVVSVEPVFAFYENYLLYNRSKQAKAKAFFRKTEKLREELRTLANKIATYNKPAFEAKLTKQEQQTPLYVSCICFCWKGQKISGNPLGNI